MAQLQENNLLIPDVKESDIMKGMLTKMVDESQVNEKIAQFITKDDNDVILWYSYKRLQQLSTT